MIRRGQYDFDSPEWDVVSEQAKDLIRGLLLVDSSVRMTAAQVLRHPWVKNTANTEHLGHAVEKLKQFNARRKWKGAMGAVRAGVRMKMMVRGLRSAAAEVEAGGASGGADEKM